MRRQLNRLDSSSRDVALRTALESRRKTASRAVDCNTPFPWWRPADTAAHATWINAPEPIAVSYAALSPTSQWPAGQPVRLITEGHEHLCWVKCEAACFSPRWLAGDMRRKLVSPAELTFRNPRDLWANPWIIQLALALLAANYDSRCKWLENPDPTEEAALAGLLIDAQEELARRPQHAFFPAAPEPPAPTPAPLRGWTKRELDAMRAASAAPPEYVLPGRARRQERSQ